MKAVTRVRYEAMTCLRLSRLGLCLVLTVWAMVAQAQVYSWQDDQGQWHFADHAPVGGAERRALDDLPDLNTMRPPEDSPYQPPSPRSSAQRSQRSASGQDARCDSLERRLEAVQRELRAGYQEPRGNRLRARRRQMSAAHRRECRDSLVGP
ncbi:DUF4124 domain-containing protein [Halomonas salinarum]|uniref:DUF4124 domain-containing protein n=1 Tax=Halomonas salinarum TaxID=1158993 RepID=UPI00143CB306|nr:DUF4124 domain-containing protein [Halomonas salinarum]